LKLCMVCTELGMSYNYKCIGISSPQLRINIKVINHSPMFSATNPWLEISRKEKNIYNPTK